MTKVELVIIAQCDWEGPQMRRRRREKLFFDGSGGDRCRTLCKASGIVLLALLPP
jgi:hypothetical protein